MRHSFDSDNTLDCEVSLIVGAIHPQSTCVDRHSSNQPRKSGDRTVQFCWPFTGTQEELIYLSGYHVHLRKRERKSWSTYPLNLYRERGIGLRYARPAREIQTFHPLAICRIGDSNIGITCPFAFSIISASNLVSPVLGRT